LKAAPVDPVPLRIFPQDAKASVPRGRSPLSSLFFIQPRNKRVSLFLRFFSRYSIAFLQTSYQLIALPGNYLDVVVSKLSPLFSEFSFRLFPLSLYLIPVHKISPLV
jgi:hypothetical protein